MAPYRLNALQDLFVRSTRTQPTSSWMSLFDVKRLPTSLSTVVHSVSVGLRMAGVRGGGV